MRRRQREDGRWEVLVNTPTGYVWQLESLPTPGALGNTSRHWSASFNPFGKNEDAYTKQVPYTNMFDAEFGSLLKDAFKTPKSKVRMVKKGGPQKPFAKEYPIYKTPLHLKRR